MYIEDLKIVLQTITQQFNSFGKLTGSLKIDTIESAKSIISKLNILQMSYDENIFNLHDLFVIQINNNYSHLFIYKLNNKHFLIASLFIVVRQNED